MEQTSQVTPSDWRRQQLTPRAEAFPGLLSLCPVSLLILSQHVPQPRSMAAPHAPKAPQFLEDASTSWLCAEMTVCQVPGCAHQPNARQGRLCATPLPVHHRPARAEL